MAMQAADVAPTTPQVTACERARSAYVAVMLRWNTLRTTGLATLNARRKAAGEPPLSSGR